MNESNEWTRQGRRQEKKKKRGRIGFVLILLLAIIAVAGTYYASRINHTINTITQDVGNRTEQEANDIIKNAKPINILFIRDLIMARMDVRKKMDVQIRCYY